MQKDDNVGPVGVGPDLVLAVLTVTHLWDCQT